ncbi:MAG: hypothetical protein IJD57_03720 [Candidatus Gastranaerophilales bacterium]|nr:hypothetical protein [Candidatus Gastranaerophilales bacterium]
MIKRYIDAGTTWTKILEIQDGKKEYKVISTAEFRKLNLDYEKSTGHSLDKIKNKYENEVVALSYGAKKYLEDDFIALDLGSRDIKYVKFQNKKFKDMDWNASCASATGATVEMLLKFYDVDIKNLKYTPEKYAVTCGIFGLEKIMDDVSKGLNPEIAISKFIHGLAYNAYNFTKNPEKICISGGFCENDCFIESLKQYCEVLPLGRFILVDGLLEMEN